MQLSERYLQALSERLDAQDAVDSVLRQYIEYQATRIDALTNITEALRRTSEAQHEHIEALEKLHSTQIGMLEERIHELNQEKAF